MFVSVFKVFNNCIANEGKTVKTILKVKICYLLSPFFGDCLFLFLILYYSSSVATIVLQALK